tara:strand:- start:750 stop:851 length:102 start_codon:yes stop_codon:yes gene_type:complete
MNGWSACSDEDPQVYEGIEKTENNLIIKEMLTA